MYPFLRLAYHALAQRTPRPQPLLREHVSDHICWPWDLDPWNELNNGRTLTLYDLGRVPMLWRSGLIEVLRHKGWGFTVAGASVRYRKRVRNLARFRMRSRVIGWDARFFYMEQSIWLGNGDCANHILLRMAVAGPDGIVPPAQVVQAAGEDPGSPPIPPWVTAWIDAEAQRPWPPMQEAPPPQA